jgi:hypothetical protein
MGEAKQFGADEWTTEEVLITVRAYPQPSAKYMETSCVAGVTMDGQLRRLHPVPDRFLARSDRFKKYDVLRLQVKRSDDPRPESRRVRLDAPFPKVGSIPTDGNWLERDRHVESFRAASIEGLIQQIDALGKDNAPSLALIRPTRIVSFQLKPKTESDWRREQQAKLAQVALFHMPMEPLEYIPCNFVYHFYCAGQDCRGHHMSVVDWEVAQSYRKWKQTYPDKWEWQMQQKYFQELPGKDLQFFVGTQKKWPKTWSIVGLYYPPRR